MTTQTCPENRTQTPETQIISNPFFQQQPGNSQRQNGEDVREVAYILKGYPRLSEVFITNEIYLLEQMGLRLRIFVIKKATEEKSHPVVQKINAPVTYLPKMTSLTKTPFGQWLKENVPAVLPAHRALFKDRPAIYLKTFGKALWRSLRFRSGRWRGPKKVFFKEFLQAGFIAFHLLEAGNVRHLHAHFCHGSTTVAMFVSELSGLPFSFTAHAKDIYLPSLNPGKLLQLKIQKARFVATCTGANREHLQKISSNGTPIFAIRHGLDVGHFAPVKKDKSLHAPLTILAVGRFVKKKGFVFLVQACKLLKDRGLSFNCHIIGEPDEQSSLIQEMIQKYDLSGVVHIRSGMTQAELREFYQHADIFALPCRVMENGDRDGIPNVLAEAMAMEVPVVSTAISGIPELITHGADGLLIAEKDPYALANALETLLTNVDLREQLGKAARQKILRIFDSATTTEMLKEVFLASIKS